MSYVAIVRRYIRGRSCWAESAIASPDEAYYAHACADMIAQWAGVRLCCTVNQRSASSTSQSFTQA